MSSDLLIYAVQILTFCFLIDPYKQYYNLLKSSHWSDPLTEAFDHQLNLNQDCTHFSLLRPEFDPPDRQWLYETGYGGRPLVHVGSLWVLRLLPTQMTPSR